MGCGSSKNTNATGPTKGPPKGPTQDPTQGPTQDPTQDPTQGPTQDPTQGTKITSKQNISVSFDPLTTLKVIQLGSLQAKMSITSGPAEAEQFPIVSGRLYSSDKVLTIVLSDTKNFTVVAGKLYPKISYSLCEKANSANKIASNEDYHNFSSSGTDLSGPEIKIVLPLHELKPKVLMLLSLSIKDAKGNPDDEIKSAYIFSIDPTLIRVPGENNTLVACQGFDGFSLNGLNVPSITVLQDKEELKEPYRIEYGKLLFVRFNGITGFAKNGDSVNPGCSLLSLNEEGEEIFFAENIIPEDNDFHEDEVAEIAPHIRVAGEKFKPDSDFWFNIRLWDRKGPGQLGLKIRYQGVGKFKDRVTVYEVKPVENEQFEVKCKGKGQNGVIDTNLVYFTVGKDFSEVFAANLDRTVELDVAFDGDFKSKKLGILEISGSNDGIQRKAVPWRLVSVSPQQ